jgi:formate/nitrite transporter
MSNVCLTPKETSEALILTAQNKVAMSVQKRLLMSIMAGLYISLGAQGFMVGYENLFLRAAVFPVGLMLIVLVGGELYTGNCLMTFALMQKKITLTDFLKNLSQVLLGNLIGSLIVVALLYFGGVYNNPALSETIVKIAHAKLNLSFVQALSKGILCNILVSLGVWFATTAKDTTGKLLGCWFPVMLFVLCGYEHVVANMFYLPMALIFDHSITIGQILINNFIPVAIGNLIGGGVLVPMVYYRVYHK